MVFSKRSLDFSFGPSDIGLGLNKQSKYYKIRKRKTVIVFEVWEIGRTEQCLWNLELGNLHAIRYLENLC